MAAPNQHLNDMAGWQPKCLNILDSDGRVWSDSQASAHLCVLIPFFLGVQAVDVRVCAANLGQWGQCEQLD